MLFIRKYALSGLLIEMEKFRQNVVADKNSMTSKNRPLETSKAGLFFIPVYRPQIKASSLMRLPLFKKSSNSRNLYLFTVTGVKK